jgi:DNA replication and repair protein RecF
MLFASLRIASFRNLVDAELETAGKDVFLIGENGQGKTNFLEAVYFCSYASSFRGVSDGELPRNGEKSCSVEAKFSGSLYDKTLIKFENGRKTIFLDGKRLDDRRELLSVSPCIVFCHEDMEFVTGSPERRRWFFDQSQSLYDQVYLDDLHKYRRVLKTRNMILREARETGGVSGGKNAAALLDALDPQIAMYGLGLMEKRAEAARCFSDTFGRLYKEVSGIDGVMVRYAPSWKFLSDSSNSSDAPVDGTDSINPVNPTDKINLIDRISKFLYGKREADMAAAFTLSGPHRDRYVFIRNGVEFSGKASTGQRRLLALLLRVAQARRFCDMTGKRAVLLLDDVLLELDPEKRWRFLGCLPEYDQAFYTFLPEEPYERYRKSDTLVYDVTDGCMRKT